MSASCACASASPRLCIALLRRSRVQLRGLLLVLLYAFALAGSECSGLAAALAVRPQVASAWQPAQLHLRHACSPGPRCHGRSACVEAASAAISSPVTSSAPPCTWCTRRMAIGAYQQPAGAPGAAASSSAQGPRPPTPLSEHRTAAGACSAGLRCHSRLARVEAVSAAVNSPVTSSAPPWMWCTRCMQMGHSSS